MPLRGVGKGLQNVVNSWVNVNNNHVVFPEDGEEIQRGDFDRRPSTTSNFGAQVHLQGVGNDGRKRSIIAGQQHSSGTVNTSTTSTPEPPTYSYAPQSQIPMRLTQQKGKIKRTNSHSDLLLEKAAGRRISDASPMIKPRILHDRRASIPSRSTQRSTVRERQTSTSTSSIPESTASKTSSAGSGLPIKTGQYINENAFANQYRQLATAQQLKKTSPAPSEPPGTPQSSAGFWQAPPDSNTAKFEVSSEVSSEASIAASTSKPKSFSPASKIYPSKPAPANDTSTSSCNKCEEGERRILAIEIDLEFLRATALNNEYVCMSCDRRNNNLPVNSASSVASARSVRSSKSKQSKGSGRMLDQSSAHSSVGGSTRRKGRLVDSSFLSDNIALAESSQRLIDVTARHKRQIEHMSKETVSWFHSCYRLRDAPFTMRTALSHLYLFSPYLL